MKSLKNIRIALIVFISLLVISGISAFPITPGIGLLMRNLDMFPGFLQAWITRLSVEIHATPVVMLYGTDWLAFAHIVIALFFIPVYIDPVKHRANLIAGMAACLLVFPLAFICGPVRGIPFFHQLIDCSFGLLGFLLLYLIYRKINALEKNSNAFQKNDVAAPGLKHIWRRVKMPKICDPAIPACQAQGGAQTIRKGILQ